MGPGSGAERNRQRDDDNQRQQEQVSAPMIGAFKAFLMTRTFQTEKPVMKTSAAPPQVSDNRTRARSKTPIARISSRPACIGIPRRFDGPGDPAAATYRFIAS